MMNSKNVYKEESQQLVKWHATKINPSWIHFLKIISFLARVYTTQYSKNKHRTPNRGESWSMTMENTDIHLCG
jgi:hypothetical protein